MSSQVYLKAILLLKGMVGVFLAVSCEGQQKNSENCEVLFHCSDDCWLALYILTHLFLIKVLDYQFLRD